MGVQRLSSGLGVGNVGYCLLGKGRCAKDPKPLHECVGWGCQPIPTCLALPHPQPPWGRGHSRAQALQLGGACPCAQPRATLVHAG